MGEVQRMVVVVVVVVSACEINPTRNGYPLTRHHHDDHDPWDCLVKPRGGPMDGVGWVRLDRPSPRSRVWVWVSGSDGSGLEGWGPRGPR